MALEDLVSMYKTKSVFDEIDSSPFDSFNLMDNYRTLNDHTNNYFNFKANNLGEIGVLENLAGFVAKREDLSFGDISLSESYRDSALNTRVMGGTYNRTLSDMYQNKDEWLRLQGAYTFAGMIGNREETKGVKHDSPFGKNPFEKEDVFASKSAKYLGSPGLTGDIGYLEGGTVYNLKEDKKVVVQEKDSPFGKNPFEKEDVFASKSAKYLGSPGVNGDFGYIEGATVFEKDKKTKNKIVNSSNNRKLLLGNREENIFSNLKSDSSDSKLDGFVVKKKKKKVINGINPLDDKIESSDKEVDLLRATEEANRERFDSSKYEKEEIVFHKDISSLITNQEKTKVNVDFSINKKVETIEAPKEEIEIVLEKEIPISKGEGKSVKLDFNLSKEEVVEEKKAIIQAKTMNEIELGIGRKDVTKSVKLDFNLSKEKVVEEKKVIIQAKIMNKIELDRGSKDVTKIDFKKKRDF